MSEIYTNEGFTRNMSVVLILAMNLILIQGNLYMMMGASKKMFVFDWQIEYFAGVMPFEIGKVEELPGN